MMSENKPGSIEIEVVHNLDDVEARLDRILAKLKEFVELQKILEGAEGCNSMSPQEALKAFYEMLNFDGREKNDHDAT